MKSFLKWCSSKDENPEEEDADLNYERILMLLANCEHAMSKSQQMLTMNQLEMQNYERLKETIEKGIEDAQQSIVSSKRDLQSAKIIRKNKQEYDALAKIIEEHPNREETMQRLNRMEEELKKLQGIKEELNRKLEKRKKQFHVLLSAAAELKLILQDEEEDDNITESLEPSSIAQNSSNDFLKDQHSTFDEPMNI